MSDQFQPHSLKLCTDYDWHRDENLMPQFAENYQPSLIESLQAALEYHQTQRNKYVRNVQATTKLLAPCCVTELSRAVKQSKSSLRKSLEETLAEGQAKLAHHQDFVDSLQDNISACTVVVPEQQHSELEETLISESTGPRWKLEVPIEESSDNVTPLENQVEAIDKSSKVADIQQRFEDVRHREVETQQRIDDIVRLNAKSNSLKVREEKEAETQQRIDDIVKLNAKSDSLKVREEKEADTQQRIDDIVRLDAKSNSLKVRKEKDAKTAKLAHAKQRRIVFNRLWRDLRDINTTNHPSGSVETGFQPALGKKVDAARLKQSGGPSSNEATKVT